MQFGERLKQLAQQLQRAVSNNQDKIHGAVDTVGNVANKTTKGKFEDRIAKAGEKAKAGVGKVASNPDGSATATDAEGAAGAAASEAEGAAGSAASDAEGAAGSAASDAEGAGESATNEAEGFGESATNEAEGAGESAMNEAEGATDGHEDEAHAATQEGADYQQPS